MQPQVSSYWRTSVRPGERTFPTFPAAGGRGAGDCRPAYSGAVYSGGIRIVY